MRNVADIPQREAELIASGISSHEYFTRAIKYFDFGTTQSTNLAIVEGYISSAGMGSESVVQASRLALVERLEVLPTESESFSLLHVANAILDVFKAQLANDRIILPLLEVLAFLLDAQVLQRLVGSNFKYVVCLDFFPLHTKSTLANHSSIIGLSQMAQFPFARSKGPLQIQQHAKALPRARCIPRACKCPGHSSGCANEAGKHAAAPLPQGLLRQ